MSSIEIYRATLTVVDNPNNQKYNVYTEAFMQQSIEGFIWLIGSSKSSLKSTALILRRRRKPSSTSHTRCAKLLGRYLLYGRSSDGRYLFVIFVWEGRRVKVLSAREMEPAERRYYGQK